jgi:hypothetical protein
MNVKIPNEDDFYKFSAEYDKTHPDNGIKIYITCNKTKKLTLLNEDCGDENCIPHIEYRNELIKKSNE